MSKRIMLLAASLLIAVSLATAGMRPAIYAAEVKDIRIKDYFVPNNEPGELTVSGKIPQVEGLKSRDFQRELNNTIMRAKDNEIVAAGDSAKDVDFTYQQKYNGDIVSLLIYVTVTSASAEEKVLSFNFDARTEKMVGLNDPKVLGPNGVKIVNKAVLARIIAHPDDYNANFAGISEMQDFYMEKDTVTVLFDAFEIAPGYAGIQEIPVALRSVKSISLGNDSYLTQDTYHLKMIPLRQVIEGDPFYYRLAWNPETGEISITKNSRYVTRLSVGLNQYTKGQAAMRQLEAAPEIWPEQGRTVVPISFFEEILDISFSVDSGGRITFSQYTPPPDI